MLTPDFLMFTQFVHINGILKILKIINDKNGAYSC